MILDVRWQPHPQGNILVVVGAGTLSFVHTLRIRGLFRYSSSVWLAQARATKRFERFDYQLTELLVASLVVWLLGIVMLAGKTVSLPIEVAVFTWMICGFVLSSKNMRLTQRLASLNT